MCIVQHCAALLSKQRFMAMKQIKRIKLTFVSRINSFVGLVKDEIYGLIKALQGSVEATAVSRHNHNVMAHKRIQGRGHCVL